MASALSLHSLGPTGKGLAPAPVSCHCSSLSQWVHACDALELPAKEREQLDAVIDQLYKDIEKETGEFLNCEGSGLYMLQSCCEYPQTLLITHHNL
ncbi:hypothetical protein GDO78_022632 [Eleutherodactylus coqui]|uniref:Uncharacterized protein n=1 Tax=Eleutherodactylus coqui TaxID=57060 RepID=A0A8J6BHY6_ELECQ|nr:hypothetical protein GDO78_022632 [Eleutherodactylus coqui]